MSAASPSFEVEHGEERHGPLAAPPAPAAGRAGGGEATLGGAGGAAGNAAGAGVAAAAAAGPPLPPPRRAGGPPARSVCQSYLSGGKIYSCCHCRAHLASHDEIISKSFQGHHGRAYLFNNLINVSEGPKEERILITGLHTVCDIYCNVCQAVLGWKYEEAFEESQKYKEGKFIVEKLRMMCNEGWV